MNTTNALIPRFPVYSGLGWEKGLQSDLPKLLNI